MPTNNEPSRGRPFDTWEKIDRAVKAFEDAWEAGHGPLIENFLIGADSERRQCLTELIHVDLERRLKAGEAARVEHYIEQFPELRDDKTAVVGLLAAEYRLRREFGPGCDREEILRRFPEYQVELEAALPNEVHAAPAPNEDAVPLPPTDIEEPAKHVGAPPVQKALPSGGAPDLPTVRGYVVLEKLSQGGMGIVYKARQLGFNRIVALKMIRSHFRNDPEFRVRFANEAEAIARLQHPHIVQVFQVGEHENVPYFSMEFCPGGSLHDKLHGTPLPAKEAAILVRSLAQGVGAAHAAGVIHRDLKPANVLLDAAGTPKVTDFGLARKLDEALQGETGVLLGTPEYMAPEQAEAKGRAVGEPADVYALGAILYECLTGRPPFKAATVLETLAQVKADDPVRPSQLNPGVPLDLETVCLKCLEKYPAKRYQSAAELEAELRRFQDGEPVRARPIGRFARAVKWARRHPARAFAVAVTAIALAVVIGSIVTALVQISAARDDAIRQQIVAQNLAAEKGVLADANGALAESNGELAAKERRGRLETQEQLLRQRNTTLTAQLLRFQYVAAVDPRRAGQLLDDCNACPLDLRDAAWRLYSRSCNAQQPTTLVADNYGFYAVAFAPDGRRAATSARTGKVTVWDIVADRVVSEIPSGKVAILSLAFDRSGTVLVGGGNDGSVRFWDADRGTQTHVLNDPQGGFVNSVALSPDANTVVTLTHAPMNRGSPPQSGLTTRVRAAVAPATTIGVAATSNCLAIAATAIQLRPAFAPPSRVNFERETTLSAWDRATDQQKRIVTEQQAPPQALACSPDGKTVATCDNNTVRIWDLSTGHLVRTLPSLPATVSSLAFHPSGRFLALGAWDHTVRLWDLSATREIAVLQDAKAGVTGVAFSSDGRLLAAGSSDESLFDRRGAYEVLVWDLTASRPARRLSGSVGVPVALSITPGGSVISGSLGDPLAGNIAGRRRAPGGLVRWDLASSKPLVFAGHLAAAADVPASNSSQRPSKWVNAVAFSPDGSTIASAGDGGIVFLWDRKTAEVRAKLDAGGSDVWTLAYSPDGTLVAWSGFDDKIHVRNVLSGKQKWERAGGGAGLWVLRFSPEGKYLAAGGADGNIRILNAADGSEERVLRRHRHPVLCLAYSRNGFALASGAGSVGGKEPGELVLWDMTKSGGDPAELRGHESAVRCVAFSTDGKTLASGDGFVDQGGGLGAGSLRLWDAESGRAKAVNSGPEVSVCCLAVSPDGVSMASGGADGQVRLRDAVTGQERSTLSAQTPGNHQFRMVFRKQDINMPIARSAGRAGSVLAIAFSPDGNALVCCGTDGTARLWELGGGPQIAVLRGQGHKVTALAWRPDGQQFATADTLGWVRRWDAVTGQELLAPADLKVEGTALAFSPDGKTLAAGTDDGMVRLLDAETGQTRLGWRQGKEDGFRGKMVSLAFRPDGGELACGDGHIFAFPGAKNPATIHLVDPTTGKKRAELAGHMGSVIAMAYTPDGKGLASVGADGTVRLWNMETGSERAKLLGDTQKVFGVAMRPDGEVLASASVNGTIRLWEFATGKERRVLKGPEGALCLAVAFSPDGRTLAGSMNHRDSSPERVMSLTDSEREPPTTPAEIYLWDSTNGKVRGKLQSRSGEIWALSFSPDGKRLVSGHEDGTLRLWDARAFDDRDQKLGKVTTDQKQTQIGSDSVGHLPVEAPARKPVQQPSLADMESPRAKNSKPVETSPQQSKGETLKETNGNRALPPDAGDSSQRQSKLKQRAADDPTPSTKSLHEAPATTRSSHSDRARKLRGAPADGAIVSVTERNKIASLEAQLRAKPGVFDAAIHNELRHLYLAVDQKKSFEHCEAIFQHSVMDPYTLDCLGARHNGTPQARTDAIKTLLSWPEKYPEFIHVSAACWIKAAELLDDDHPRCKELLKRVESLKGNDLDRYRKLAATRLRAVEKP
jgi:WD40 repeat protein/tRNA A-37 threonylcarbamoyl transferase component Bud32